MNNETTRATKVVQSMLEQDAFSAWLGVTLKELSPGRCVLEMRIRKDMLNGFYRCHGGIPFALADSALAFASNSHGQIAVSIENSIAYPAAIVEDDVLTATCEEVTRSEKIGTYHVAIKKSDDSIVGIFRGTVYRTSKTFF